MDDEQLNEWADSFEVTSDDAPDTPDVEEKEVDNEPTESEESPEEESPQEADTKDEEPDEEQGASDDTEEGTGDAEETGEPDTKEAEDTPVEEVKLTRDDIKNVLKEVEQEKTSYTDEIKQTTKDVIESFYPQGIDRQLRDKDGDPIRSIEDVMERIDPRTGENFTEEAAGRWLLSEQQKLNQQIEELERSAERVAEVNVTLKQDANRVVDKYGDILTKNPQLAQKIKTRYEQSLRRDPKTGITLEAPIPLIEFYDDWLEPYVTGGAQQPTPAPAEPEKPKANPSDRADLPTTNGNDSNLSKEEREWAEISKEYQSQRN